MTNVTRFCLRFGPFAHRQLLTWRIWNHLQVVYCDYPHCGHFYDPFWAPFTELYRIFQSQWYQYHRISGPIFYFLFLRKWCFRNHSPTHPYPWVLRLFGLQTSIYVMLSKLVPYISNNAEFGSVRCTDYQLMQAQTSSWLSCSFICMVWYRISSLAL